MSATRARGPLAPRISRDRWLVGYADMITLLFACFASLYAAKLNLAPPAMTDRLNVIPVIPIDQAPPGGDGTAPIAPNGTFERADQTELRRALERAVAQRGDLRALDLIADARGYIISLPESGSFPTGNAELTPAAQAVLLDLANALRQAPNAIRVEGHTDDVPIHTAAFASNWELSTARATRVVQFLIERGGLDAARLSAAGYGEFHPRAPNSSDAARARNRRIDIVVLNAATAAREEPSAGARQ